jgi:hypothetical protein
MKPYYSICIMRVDKLLFFITFLEDRLNRLLEPYLVLDLIA